MDVLRKPKGLLHACSRLSATALFISGCITPLTLQAETNTAFTPVYIGGGVGLSHLSPDTPDSNTFDSQAHSVGVSIGYDVTDSFSIEMGLSNLGEAHVGAGNQYDGSVSYTQGSISLIGYGLRDESSTGSPREGFSMFGRLGITQVEQENEFDPTADESSTGLLIGAGSEYGWENGLAARAELTFHSDDASTLNMGLLKRFRSKADRELETSARQAATGIAKHESLWSNRLSVSLPIIHFDEQTGQPRLDREHQNALAQLARELSRHESLEIVVQGHSSHLGHVRDKLKQSRQQAILVSRFLQSRGISGNRMHLRSYGDTRPLPAFNNNGQRHSSQRVDFEIYSRG